MHIAQPSGPNSLFLHNKIVVQFLTHNEALRTLDALVQLMVLDKDLASPPGSPADGDRYRTAPGLLHA